MITPIRLVAVFAALCFADHYATAQLPTAPAPRPIQPSIVRWTFWANKLVERDSDRKEILRQFEKIAADDPAILDLWGNDLRDLRLTVAPRKSKPGSVEALIDDLMDYWDEGGDEYNETGHGAYWKLVELGFEAVPALMVHREDSRLTRAEEYGLTGIKSSRFKRVSDLIQVIIMAVSHGEFEEELIGKLGTEGAPGKDHKWWKEARQVGEAKWLIEHALPEATKSSLGYDEVLRVIVAKYPGRIPGLYRDVLSKPPGRYACGIPKAILASRQSWWWKVALLAEGAQNSHDRHRGDVAWAISEWNDTVKKQASPK